MIKYFLSQDMKQKHEYLNEICDSDRGQRAKMNGRDDRSPASQHLSHLADSKPYLKTKHINKQNGWAW